MRHIARLIGSIAIATTAFGSSAMAQDTPAAGLAIARQLCSECHDIERSPQPRSPNTAAPPFMTIANVPGMTGMALSAALQTPHRTMPNVILDANQLSSIVAYVLSLRRAN
jgi:mono/diheme cytochrome c family protein